LSSQQEGAGKKQKKGTKPPLGENNYLFYKKKESTVEGQQDSKYRGDKR